MELLQAVMRIAPARAAVPCWSLPTGLWKGLFAGTERLQHSKFREAMRLLCVCIRRAQLTPTQWHCGIAFASSSLTNTMANRGATVSADLHCWTALANYTFEYCGQRVQAERPALGLMGINKDGAESKPSSRNSVWAGAWHKQAAVTQRCCMTCRMRFGARQSRDCMIDVLRSWTLPIIPSSAIDCSITECWCAKVGQFSYSRLARAARLVTALP
eukprot:1611792-Amphidinium_carterae.1